MADTTTCAQCGGRNDAGASFCSTCGASLSPQTQCPSCNTLNPVGNRFCNRCGASLENAGWPGVPGPQTGGVVEGVWERGGEELIRRVDPEDARRFLGTRTVRVPAGTVGVVLVDGVVERVMPAGEQTTLGVFERIANFFLRRERTAFYLVDQRPFPVPFVVRTRANSAGRTVKSQVLVTFMLPRGDRDALSRFIANVLGPRPAFTTGDLYNLLRPEVVRISQEVLERAAAGDQELSYPDAEAAIRRALADSVGPVYGLTVDATLAPLTAVASLNFRLGTGVAPLVRPCVACRHELPASLKFCDACGAKQPEVLVGGTPPSVETPLFTADGQQVELDLVVRVQGQHDDFGPQRIAPALVGAAASHLRGTQFPALSGPGGFTALEQAMAKAAADALESYGLSLVALSVVDARTKTGEWLLSARADLERARDEVRLGLAWLDQRDGELDLEQLTLTRVLREQAQKRDHAFARDDAATADRERRDGLAARDAVVEVAGAQRKGATRAVVDGIEQERQNRDQAHQNQLRKTRVEAELAELQSRRDLDFADLERRKRLELELAAVAEAQQLDKLRGMAEIERDNVAQEQAHEMAKRKMLQGLSPEEMIALQAAELAKAEGGGAAWANVLAQKSNAETERRHAEETRALLERQQAASASMYEKAMGSMADVARSRAEAAPVIAGAAGAPVVTVASTTTEAPPTKPCKSCGASLKAEARFCGACGTSQV